MRRFFLIGLLLVGAIVAFSQDELVTHAEDWEKVLAPKGVFEERLLWHEYGAFGLYRVSVAALAALSPTERAALKTSAQLDTLTLTAHTFNTQLDPIETRSAQKTTGGEALSLVQFVGPIKQAWLDALVTGGIRPIHYINQNAYLVWTDDAGRAALQTATRHADTIQYVVDYLPTFKLDATLRQRNTSRTAIPITVQMIQHAGAQKTEQLIAELAGEKLNWQPILQFQNADLTLSSAEIDLLLAQPDVFWIGERFPPVLFDEVQAQIIARNLNATKTEPSGTGYLAWLDGLGFSRNSADYPIVDIVDDGIGNGNVANGAGDVTLTTLGNGTSSRLAYIANCTAASSGGGENGHGHINISIAGGYDQRSGFPFRDPLGYQRGQGINPYGRFAGTRIFAPSFNLSQCGFSSTGLLKSQQDNGAVISSNSWGANNRGGYDSMAQAFDVAVRDADLEEVGNQAMIALVAAGNVGSNAATVGSPATAKNVIAVGASENVRPNDEDGTWTDGCDNAPNDANSAMDVAGFSSRGPVEGNRIKPDLIAPGTHIQGTASTNGSYDGSGVCDRYRPSGQTIFAASSGTSHSTPAVAGVTSLYYHWLETQYNLTPSPAMMKAYLIAHPTYLTGVSANDTLPSNAQGYGMPNMTTAFDNTTRYLDDQATIFDNAGETWTFSGGISDGTKPVRVVLAWTDAAGALSGDPSVNDLDLSVSINGTPYLGNVFTGEWSSTGGSTDGVNNVEAVYLPAGTTGQIEVTITAANVAGDGVPNSGDATDQDFAFVCYNCAETPDFTLLADPMTASSCVADDVIYALSIGAIQDFAAPVTLSAQLPTAATGIFSANPVTPVGTSQLTIDTKNMAAGQYMIPIVGMASSGQHTVTVALKLDASLTAATVLQAPANESIDQSLLPTLTWTDTGADSYILEVATDAAFGNLVINETVTATSYMVTNQLGTNTQYYWRVRGVNGCGESVNSAEFSFTTASITCNLYPSSDIPIGIGVDPTIITSTLNIAASGEILDVNVRDLVGTHSYMSDLAFTLKSPAGTRIDLFAGVCGSSNDFNLDLDDEATTGVFACPLTGGAAYRPTTPLSAFDGQFLTGEWSLTLDDSESFDGGSLNGWGLEICSTVPVPQNDFALQVAPESAEICLPDSSTHTVSVQPLGEFDEVVSLTATGVPGGVAAEFAQSNITNATTLTLTADNSATTGSYLVDITGSASITSHTTTLPLTLLDTPAAVTLTSPSSGAADVNTTPTFRWQASAAADSYLFELSTSPTFSTLITSTIVTANQLTLPTELTLDTLYYWRVTPSNVCGAASSTVSSFATQAGSLACGNAVMFETGIPVDWVANGSNGLNWVRSDSAECNSLGNLTGGTGLAACVNRDRLGGNPIFPYNSTLTTNSFDLSTSQAATVTVKTRYFDNSRNADDGLAIERYNGSQWVTLLDSTGTNITAETLTFALPTNTEQLRFRYFGDGWDQYAQVDDVALSCLTAGEVTAVALTKVTTQSPSLLPLILSFMLLAISTVYAKLHHPPNPH